MHSWNMLQFYIVCCCILLLAESRVIDVRDNVPSLHKQAVCDLTKSMHVTRDDRAIIHVAKNV